MDNGMGKTVKLFNSWKGLPLLKDGDKIIKCNKFERKLSNFATK